METIIRQLRYLTFHVLLNFFSPCEIILFVSFYYHYYLLFLRREFNIKYFYIFFFFFFFTSFYGGKIVIYLIRIFICIFNWYFSCWIFIAWIRQNQLGVQVQLKDRRRKLSWNRRSVSKILILIAKLLVKYLQDSLYFCSGWHSRVPLFFGENLIALIIYDSFSNEFNILYFLGDTQDNLCLSDFFLFELSSSRNFCFEKMGYVEKLSISATFLFFWPTALMCVSWSADESSK